VQIKCEKSREEMLSNWNFSSLRHVSLQKNREILPRKRSQERSNEVTKFRDEITFSRLFYFAEKIYLRPAAIQTLNVGTRLPKIISVVENFFVATTRLVLYVVQRTDLAFSLDV